jgi:hypothetical protein
MLFLKETGSSFLAPSLPRPLTARALLVSGSPTDVPPRRGHAGPGPDLVSATAHRSSSFSFSPAGYELPELSGTCPTAAETRQSF